MASRKRLASWSTALSEEREAREEAEDEQLAAERQVDELQDQIAEVEAEREGLESRLAAVGAEREARAETERDLEEALEQLQTTEELTTSLQAELEASWGRERPQPGAAVALHEWIVIVLFFGCSHLLLLATSLRRRCSSRGSARGRTLRPRA